MDSSLSNELKDMGFSDEQIIIGIKYAPEKTLEGVITWISENPEFKEPMETETKPQEEVKAEGEQPKTEAQPQPEGEPISGLVNQVFAQGLEAMGYSKNVREKALFMVQSNSIEAAMEWIDKHRDDTDFEEQLFMVKQEEGPRLSKEEAEAKAKELGKQVRERRAKKEAEDELERERNRILSGRGMQDAKRSIEELQTKQAIEWVKKEKMETEIQKQKMLEQLERDKADRLGKNYVPIVKKEKTFEEKISTAFAQMKIVYPIHSYPDTMKVCLQTIRKILENIIKNPTEEKYQKIKLANEAFKTRVGDVVGGLFILDACGFKEEDGFLMYRGQNFDVLQVAIQKIDAEVLKL